ncbi:hypothetical protein FC87_GL000386 [Fructilactobacillus florum DSM 22689 = JCM 16035]|uniref:Uncharacterized protein n=1 Tax=Fructilactobacillus florum DSM 22689 = JCM 16035 TaxID=1423745 RepID=A0A0R2CXN7_9LACO|nr:hypothetical protein FC87_GL000386 [Fructilactobacillus florum DSM 22689 = JCM 16035]
MLLCLGWQSTVRAAAPYSVNPLLTKLPIQSKKAYFALNSKDNHTYQLPLLLKNNSNQSLTVTTSLNNAYTADNGVIAYNQPSWQRNNPHRLTNKLVGPQQQVTTLAPDESKVVTYQLATKKQEPGIVLGGVNVSAPLPSNGKIENKLEYVVGVSLNSNANRVRLKQLRLSSVQLKSQANHEVLQSRLQNPAAQLIQHGTATVKVYRGKKLLRTTKLTNVSLAPKTTTNLVTPAPKRAKGTKTVVSFKAHRQQVSLKRAVSS